MLYGQNPFQLHEGYRMMGLVSIRGSSAFRAGLYSAECDSHGAVFGPRSDREWRHQYGPAIGAEVVQ